MFFQVVISRCCTKKAPLAQLVEHLTLNQGVQGSSPWRCMRGRRLAIDAGLWPFPFAFLRYLRAGTQDVYAMKHIFDTHAHYDDSAFDPDRESIIKSLSSYGVEKVTDIGAGIESSKAALELSKKYEMMYCALGVIPGSCSDINEETWKWLCESVKSEEKCVAVGEIGLDYHWDDDPRPLQKKCFEDQMYLAREAEKPIVVHSRDAAKDTIDIMKGCKAGEIGGVIHCYSYSAESARDFLNMGFYFGIGGVITFKNARKLVEAVEYIPLSNIVLETDCPYLAPVPHRGERNFSGLLDAVVKKVSEIKKISPEEVCEQTWQNAHRLYKLG